MIYINISRNSMETPIRTQIISIEDNQIIPTANHPRYDWEQAFVAMAENGDDALLDEDIATNWDESEWQWE
jgi:hypothetical protein